MSLLRTLRGPATQHLPWRRQVLTLYGQGAKRAGRIMLAALALWWFVPWAALGDVGRMAQGLMVAAACYLAASVSASLGPGDAGDADRWL